MNIEIIQQLESLETTLDRGVEFFEWDGQRIFTPMHHSGSLASYHVVTLRVGDNELVRRTFPPSRDMGLHVIGDLAIYDVYIDPKWTGQKLKAAIIKASHELCAAVPELTHRGD